MNITATVTVTVTIATIPDACERDFYQTGFDTGGEPVCEECPTEGVGCGESGITIQSLPILEGYWRYISTTSQVFACDHPPACQGSPELNVSAYNVTNPFINFMTITTNVLDTNYGDGLCASKYEGVLCG